MLIPRLARSDLNEFVKKFIAGEIFTSAQIPTFDMNLIPCIFMPLALGALDISDQFPPEPKKPDPISEEMLDDIAMGYEDGEVIQGEYLEKVSVWEHEYSIWREKCQGISKEASAQIGIFYAHMNTAFPRSINGYPCFPEVSILHIEDWITAHGLIVKAQAAMDSILEGES